MKKSLSRLGDYNFFEDALLRKIFIISMALAMAFLLSNFLFILPSFNRYMVQEKKEHAISVARHLSSFVNLGKAPLRRETLPVEFLKQAVRYKNDFGLIKLKVFSNGGEIIFSTDAEDTVGIQQESFLNEVLAKGGVQANVIRKNLASYEGERFPVEAVETYVPLMQGNNFQGVFEIYYDITQRKKEFLSLLWRSFFILCGMGAGLLIIIAITLIRENNIVTGRKRAEETLAWESGVNAALSELYQPLISPEATIESMTKTILDQAKTLTRSEHGYVGSIDPANGDVIVHTFNEMLRGQCEVAAPNRRIVFPRSESGLYPGLWGHSLNTGEAFYTNFPEKHEATKGIPEGHIPVHRFLSVPVKLGEKMVGQISLCNKAGEYTEKDIEAVNRLAGYYSLAIQRVRVEEALQQAHDSLERRIKERTQELIKSNKRLMREIEEHRQTEGELSRAKSTLQSVFDGISDPLVMLDHHLSVVMLNWAARKYYQVKDDAEIVGKVCYAALNEGSEPCKGCEVPSVIISGQRKMFERRGVMDSERWENVVVYPLKGKIGKRTDAIIHVRDITEQKLFEKQLLQSEKLASLGILVSSIAHEINNPNSFITFNTPILKEYLGELMPIADTYADARPGLELFHMPYPEFRKDLFRLLDNIEHGAIRIKSVVDNLREFSRGKDKRELKWIDLKSVIEKALVMCETKLRKTVKTFAMDIPEDLPNIYSDPHALEQILINLILNAAHASDKNESRVALSVATGRSWLDNTIIRVSDNGCGMDLKTQKHIFDPFFSTKSRSDGTGLGLYITHNLVTGLGGRIEVESVPGEGSVFRVILPDKERRKEKRD